MRLQRLQCAVFVFCSAASAVTVTYSSTSFGSKLPSALTLLRESDESCTVISLAITQRHRLLLDQQDVVVERKLFRDASPRHHVSSLEQVQFFGYEPDNLWTKAKELCPDLASPEARGDFSQTIRADQHTFLTTRPSIKPELELYPLVLSGPSENRVDLTFFSDGCM